jgi:hypothetical protein
MKKVKRLLNYIWAKLFYTKFTLYVKEDWFKIGDVVYPRIPRIRNVVLGKSKTEQGYEYKMGFSKRAYRRSK